MSKFVVAVSLHIVFCTLFQAEHNETGLLVQLIFSNGNFDSFYGLLLLLTYITATYFLQAFSENKREGERKRESGGGILLS